MSKVSIAVDGSGRVLLVEPEQRPGLDRRVFRQIHDRYEWAHFKDVQENGDRARFYGWASKDLPVSLASP